MLPNSTKMAPKTDNSDRSGENLSVLYRLVTVLVSPTRVFEAIWLKSGRIEWVAPLAIVALLSIVAAQITFPIAVSDQRVTIEKSDRITKEQKEEILSKLPERELFGRVSVTVSIPLMLLIVVLIQSGFFHLCGNLILSGDVQYNEILTVISYSHLVAIPATIVRLPMIFATGTTRTSTNLALLLRSGFENSLVYGILSQIDLFTFWQLALSAIGVSVLFQFSLKKSGFLAFLLWAIWVILNMTIQRGVSG